MQSLHHMVAKLTFHSLHRIIRLPTHAPDYQYAWTLLKNRIDTNMNLWHYGPLLHFLRWIFRSRWKRTAAQTRLTRAFFQLYILRPHCGRKTALPQHLLEFPVHASIMTTTIDLLIAKRLYNSTFGAHQRMHRPSTADLRYLLQQWGGSEAAPARLLHSPTGYRTPLDVSYHSFSAYDMMLLSHRLLRMLACGNTRSGAVAMPSQKMRGADTKMRWKANYTCAMVERPRGPFRLQASWGHMHFHLLLCAPTRYHLAVIISKAGVPDLLVRMLPGKWIMQKLAGENIDLCQNNAGSLRYVCYCGKAFKRKKHLRRHQTNHGQRRFTCYFC